MSLDYTITSNQLTQRSPLPSNKFPDGFKKLVIAHSDRQLTKFLTPADSQGFSRESALNLLGDFTATSIFSAKNEE